jgi:hypothetical protein
MALPKLIYAVIREVYKYEEIDSSKEAWELLYSLEPTKITSNYNTFFERIEEQNVKNEKQNGESKLVIRKFSTNEGKDEQELRDKIERGTNFHSWAC